MDYKEKVIALLNSKELSKEQKEKLEEIFPELAEPEDEKVRKALISFLKSPFVNESITDEKVSPWIAWLEKQGEHANFRNKIQIGDKVTRNEDGVLVNLSQLKRVAKPANEEQKDILEDAILDSNEDGLVAETIRCKKEKQGEQKPVWSEEDELHIRELESLVKRVWAIGEHENDKDTIHKMSDLSFFLKTLKPQLKQEWSEEDEIGLGDTLWAIQQARKIAKDENEMGNIWYAETWLKSLKERVQPQKTWKPSDEQMDALHYVTNFDYGGHKATLVSLYEQLKKLKDAK